MATVNPFDLLGDDDNDDPSQLIATQQQKLAAAAAAAAKKAAAAPPAAKLPSKPLPPAQAVRENRSNTGYGRGGRGARGGGDFRNRDFGNLNANGFSGGGDFRNRDFGNLNANGFSGGYGGGARGEEGDGGQPQERVSYGAPRGAYRGDRRGGYGGGGYGGGNGDGAGAGGEFDRPRRPYEQNIGTDRPARRPYERHSGTDRAYGMKREGAGRGNWGTSADDTLAQETDVGVKVDDKIGMPEKHAEQGDSPTAGVKEAQAKEVEEKEEDKEMTLEEYEKVREEKRKALLEMKTKERKVDFDKDFESMQQLSLKKANTDEVFIKLGSDKDGKKKENADRDERAKKVSIQQFLKPSEGERYFSPVGRGRGRGRGGDRAPFRGGFGGGFGGGVSTAPVAAPPIEDPGHFPTLGGK